MTKKDKDLVKKAIHSIGLANNLTDAVTKEIVESQFAMIRATMDSIDFHEDLNKTNFILKHIGKIYTTEKRVVSINNRIKDK